MKPIREEKSQESLETKDPSIISISVQEVQVDAAGKVASFGNDVLDTTYTSEDRNSIQSPTLPGENSGDTRYRSVSLTDYSARNSNISRSPRSSSFSGTAANNKLLSRTLNQPRSGSDPGLGVTSRSLNGSMSSQESNENGIPSKKNFKKKGERKKSRSENSADNEHGRTSSILSDSGTPGVRLRIAKRHRGGSTVSLGISPKSSRCLSTPSESPQSVYSRDGAYGYTAWQTLKKQRSFRKELDSKLRRHSAIPEKKRTTRFFDIFYLCKFLQQNITGDVVDRVKCDHYFLIEIFIKQKIYMW